MKKVYALYHKRPITTKENGYELSISSDDIWNEKSIYLDDDNRVLKWNDLIYISFSKERLIEKADEIKKSWIKEEEQKLQTIRNLKIKPWHYDNEYDKPSLKERILRVLLSDS